MTIDFYKELRNYNSIVISSHIFPDSDAVGSAYSLARVLKNNFPSIEKVGVYLNDEVPQRNLPFIDNSLNITLEESKAADVLIGVDSAGLDRLGWVSEEDLGAYKTSFNIDHHISNTNWAETNYVFADTAACAEILAKSFFDNNLTVDVPSLNLLLAGIMDDCGCFRFLNTSAQTHEVTAQILSSGAQNAYVADLLYFNEKKEEVIAKSKLTQDIEFYSGGKIAIGIIDTKFMAEHNLSENDNLGFSDILKKISGVVHTALIREIGENNWKLSLRTKDFSGNVSAVAESFGGGGHKMAAGCRISGSRDEVKNKIVKALDNNLNG